MARLINRCHWVNLDNPLYVKYHDEEWGVPKYQDEELFELLILEMFQAGLSWEIVLRKRASFRESIDKIINYDEKKINELMNNEGIIRNKKKIMATINNAKIFKKIVKEYGSFSKYIWSYTDNKVLDGIYQTKNELSDRISHDLKNKGMSFVGSTIIYSYLQAIGIINDHERTCFKAKK